MGHRLQAVIRRVNAQFVAWDNRWNFYRSRAAIYMQLHEAMEQEEAETAGGSQYSVSRVNYLCFWTGEVMEHYYDGGAHDVVGHLSILIDPDLDTNKFRQILSKLRWMRAFYDEMTSAIRIFIRIRGIRMGSALWSDEEP